MLRGHIQPVALLNPSFSEEFQVLLYICPAYIILSLWYVNKNNYQGLIVMPYQ
jgi:hypothetical protein